MQNHSDFSCALSDRTTFYFRTSLIAALGLSLSSCASARGRPEAITSSDVKERICPSKDQMDEFASLSGDARGAFRDRVISICIGAYNRRYTEFTTSLSEESTSTNLVVDIASTGLTTIAGIASPKTAKRLTAGAGLALGVSAAVNKDLFYSATLPALLTAMEGKRTAVLADIIEFEKADPQGVRYSLARAGVDLDRYEAAGSLVTGLNELNKAANEAAAKASNELAVAQGGKLNFTATLLDPAVQVRVAALTAKVKKLTDTTVDRAKLDAMLKKLSLTPKASDKTDLKIGYVITAILDAVDSAAPANQAATITKLEADLNPLF